MMIESMQGMGAAAGEKLGNGGLTNRPDADLTINRRIAGSPDRRIAGSPDRRIAGSPDRRIAGSPDRRVAGSPNLRLAYGTAFAR